MFWGSEVCFNHIWIWEHYIASKATVGLLLLDWIRTILAEECVRIDISNQHLFRPNTVLLCTVWFNAKLNQLFRQKSGQCIKDMAKTGLVKTLPNQHETLQLKHLFGAHSLNLSFYTIQSQQYPISVYRYMVLIKWETKSIS